MIICEICEQPEFIATLAGWIHREWGAYSGYHSVKNEMSRMRQQSTTGRIPFTLLGIVGDEPVATATLMKHQSKTQSGPTYWLSYVLVPPEQRQKGYGGYIVRAVLRAAANRGVGRVFLLTTNRESFFSKHGWTSIEETCYGGRAIVMQQDILTAQEAAPSAASAARSRV